MLTHYLRLIGRNLAQIKNQSLLNIFGLAIGLASCFLILEYLRVEFSYDRHHGDGLYRVSTAFDIGEQQRQLATASPAIAAGMRRDFPEVLDSARVFKAPAVEKFLIRVDEQVYFEEQVLFADPSFFDLLTYEFLAGDATSALDQPFSVVVTEDVAARLFPQQTALGKSIEIESLWGEDLYTITGVVDNDAYRTHIDGDYYVSAMSGAVGDRFYELQEWGGNNLFYTFIQLEAASTPQVLEDKLPAWLDVHAAESLANLGFSKRLYLEAMPDLYLYSGLPTMIGSVGSSTYFYTLGFVAILILLIACINFTNLATAKALLRAKEVGLRQVVGAQRRDLIRQFMLEALVYTLIAVTLAWALASLTAPVLAGSVGQIISLRLFAGGYEIGVLVVAIVVTTLLVGAYPALYLASFKPVDVLRGYAGRRFSATQLRKLLVILQFVVSIALVQSILIVQQQLDYIETKDLGFDKLGKLIITNNSNGAKQNAELLQQRLLQHPDIVAAGRSSTYPSDENLENGLMNAPGRAQDQTVLGFTNMVDPQFMALMDFEFLSGRNFDVSRGGDFLDRAIINETLARALGYDRESAIGNTVSYDVPNRRVTFEIIGVVGDYNAFALYNEIDGQLFFMDEDSIVANSFLIADIAGQDRESMLAYAEASWDSLNPGEPFEYSFMDEAILEDYLPEQRMSTLILYATVLALLISSLGLYGLSTFAAERRSKEIAVRKTIGADVFSVVMLLSRDFIRLVALAFLVATPISWYAMNLWLSKFYFHTEPNLWLFLLGGLAAAAIAAATVAAKSLRAAVLNPVSGLRLS